MSALISEPKALKTPSEKIQRPFKHFMKTEQFSGILLIICTLLALIFANSPLSENYFLIWETNFSISLGGLSLSKPIHLWINDGLMAIFFFVVGLEIKRELMVGELNTLKKATLPVSAAIGGMLFPAFIYLIININNPAGMRGWGIPMATDIAFVIGVLAILGPKVPLSLKVFLTSLAIVDDIGAVLVIALFYSNSIRVEFLIAAVVVLAILIIINRLDINNPILFGILGILTWYCIFNSGVHATIAGILVAFTIPARIKVDTKEFIERSELLISRFKAAGERDKEILLNRQQLAALKTLELACVQVETPLQRFERLLHSWVAYLIMPLFVFANAGIKIENIQLDVFFHPVTLGVILGLAIGKQLGIFTLSYLSVHFRLTELPSGVTWRHIYGGALLGGIGFTMSLFISSLALINPINIIAAKTGIILGSLISGSIGYYLLDKNFKDKQKAYSAP
ncbi:MAG: Na+/H+ antiporter NhaA [Candidatus Heimdallarchaeota archaeon]|nr:Na+/H+ antiporter NhaA [Candidatus Heimdallarchaeota archaeon]